jgi:hypothetical protein
VQIEKNSGIHLNVAFEPTMKCWAFSEPRVREKYDAPMHCGIETPTKERSC